MNEPFRRRAKKLIDRIVHQRLFLIETGKSKNFITWQQCKSVWEQSERLRSDKQFAEFIQENEDLLLHMVAGNNNTNQLPIKQLIREAKSLAVKTGTPIQTQIKFDI